MMPIRCFHMCFLIFFIKAYAMGFHIICLYKEVDIGCNLKTMELLDYALIGVCAVIMLNTVSISNSLTYLENGLFQYIVGEFIQSLMG